MSAQTPHWLRALHRTSAMVLAAFLVAHMLNHIVGLAGQAEHIAFMRELRPYYRNAVIEPFLLALFAWQATSGTTLALKDWRARRGRVAWVQALSGLYLAGFLAIHIISVVMGRLSLGLDTDFRFAAAGFHVAGWHWFFAPYYFLAIFSLFVHAGCAIYWALVQKSPRRAQITLGLAGTLGLCVAFGVVSALAGQLFPVEIPQVYLDTYKA
jgi:succinate dehydrogenase/fumarate reductase cytochrome b subunit